MFLSGENFSKKNLKKAIFALVFIFGLVFGLFLPDGGALASLRSGAKWFIPLCNIILKDPATGSEIPNAGAGNWPANKEFDIDVSQSQGLALPITGVKFSSDNVLDGVATGNWEPAGPNWYDWNVSLRDWDATTKIKKWKINQAGNYEVWAQLKNSAGITSLCQDTISISIVNQPPTVKTAGETWNHCSFKGKSIPILNWNYTDGTQAAYWVQIDNTSASFPSPEVNTGEILLSSSSYAPTYSFNWDTRYWWQVKAKNQQGVWSNWSNTDNFDTPKHAYPWSDFSWLPQEPNQGEVVVFDPDSSETFGGTTISSYLWTITEGTGQFVAGTNNASRYPKIVFTTPNNKVKLKITDSPSNYSCECSPKTITAQLPLPEYREVPPVIWLKKALAMVVDFFNGF